MTTKEKIDKAEALGRAAAKRGDRRAAVDDPEYVKLLFSTTGLMAQIAVARAWLRGFDGQLQLDVL
jgi:hypothetical protein